MNRVWYGPQCPCGLVPCLCPPVRDIGAIVRDKILSPGFYWYDAPPAQAPGFQAWLRDNASLVKSRKTLTQVDSNVFGGPNLHIWVLFEVLFPVPWLDATKFGFPNTATKDTESTVASSVELEKDTLDVIGDSVKSIVPILAPVSSGLLVLGGVLGVGYIFRKEIFNVVSRVRKSRNPGNRRSKSA